jgi:hypothetical protein
MVRLGFNLLAFFSCLIAGILSGSIRRAETYNRDEQQIASHKYYDFLANAKPGESVSVEQEPTQIDLGEARKTFCTDPTIRPIWKLIRRTPEVREALEYVWSPFDDPDCKAMFELNDVYLDRDGRTEILVRGGGTALCGAVGNCDFWVIKREREGLRILLHADDYIDVTDMGKQVLRARTKGYADLLLKGHFSASETSYSTYKFNGKKYVETKCLYNIPDNYTDQNTKWRFITCKEFYRRLNL